MSYKYLLGSIKMTFILKIEVAFKTFLNSKTFQKDITLQLVLFADIED